mmetsp:Transcript_21421/g.49700  ORF Transcript_21421/g.49700 Transcript_21421/m.49700 type:complete len:207 (+) Transcript_21421:1482-2102(+)
MVGAVLRHHEAKVHVLVKVEGAALVHVDLRKGVLQSRQDLKPRSVGCRCGDAHCDLDIVHHVVPVLVEPQEVILEHLESTLELLPQVAVLPPPLREPVALRVVLLGVQALDGAPWELHGDHVQHVHEAREVDLAPRRALLLGEGLVCDFLVGAALDRLGQLLIEKGVELVDRELAGAVHVVLEHAGLHGFEGLLDDGCVGRVPEEC